MALRLGDLVAYLSVDDSGMKTGLDKGESMLSGFADKAKGLGLAAAGALGLSFAGSLVLDAESAQAKLQAQLGGSAQYAADMGKIAGSLYANAYGDSLGQVNEALRSVLQSGAVMEDASSAQIESVTGKVLSLATAFDQDLGAAATAVGQMMRTGMASNADEALDIITRGMQQGVDRSGDLLDTFTEYPALFQRLGLNGSTAMGLINQGMLAGARNSDLVADALKEFQIRATDGSKTSAAAFEAMGLNAQQMTAQIAAGGPSAAAGLDTVLDRLRGMEDPVARNAAAVGIFGTQAEDLGAALFAIDPTSAVAGLGQVAGAAQQVDQTMGDTASGNLTSFKRGLEQVFTNVVGGVVIPAIRDAAGWLKDHLGPAFTDIKDVINNDVIPALDSVKGWMDQNGAAVKTVALIIMGTFLPALLVMGAQATIQGLKVVASWVLMKAQAIGSVAVQSVQIMLAIGKWILLGATATIQGLKIAAVWALQVAGSAISGAASFGIAAMQVIGGWLLMGAQATLQGLKMAVVWTAQIVASAISGAAAFGVQALRVVAGWVLMGTQSLIQAGRMAAAWFIALGPVGWVIAAIVGLAIVIALNWDKIKRWTREAWEWVSNKVSGAWDAITGAVSEGVDKVSTFVGGLPGKIKGWFSDAWNWLTSAGRDLLTGLWNGISGAAGWLWGKVTGWASGLMDKVKGLFGIGSPSKVFADYGGALMQGMANGIAGSAGTAVDAALTAAGRVGGALQVAPASAGIRVNGGAGGRFGATPGIRVYIGDRELTDIVRVETGAHVDRQLGAVADQLHYAGA